MYDKQAYERALQLAPKGLCECRVCHRIGPMNGALVSWWAGVPFHALCPDCFGLGRHVVLKRHFDGIEARVMEQGDGSRIILPSSTSEASMPQTQLSRSPSKGW